MEDEKMFKLIRKSMLICCYVNKEGIVTFVNPLYEWMKGKKFFDPEVQQILKQQNVEIRIERKVKKK